MVESDIEYEEMFKVEKLHWWYRSLHGIILNQIKLLFPLKNDLIIIDAGCGTGGLLLFLKQHGYHNCEGFDISETAVRLSMLHGVKVFRAGMEDIGKHYSPLSQDIVISNDNLYFLTEDGKKKYFLDVHSILVPGGFFILNSPSMEAFRGIHDKAVGINKRIKKEEIYSLARSSGFSVVSILYWPFLLSPLIWLVRLIQRIRFKLNPQLSVRSDLSLPPVIINKILERIVLFENKFFNYKPWGSSLVVVLRKNN